MACLNKDETILYWFNTFSGDIYRFLVYYSGDVHDVEDLLQETFARGYDKMHQFRHECSPKTWLLQIARNLVLDRQRKESRFQRADESTLEILAHPDRGPEEMAVLHDVARFVLDSLSKTNENFVEVLILRGLQDMSARDAAQILGWSLTRVNVTYHRALRAARKVLLEVEMKEGEGIDEDPAGS